jgi:hypothetical protein
MMIVACEPRHPFRGLNIIVEIMALSPILLFGQGSCVKALLNMLYSRYLYHDFPYIRIESLGHS